MRCGRTSVWGLDMSVGMHYGTFAEHPEQVIDAHEEDPARALDTYGVDESAFLILAFGAGITLQ